MFLSGKAGVNESWTELPPGTSVPEAPLSPCAGEYPRERLRCEGMGWPDRVKETREWRDGSVGDERTRAHCTEDIYSK